jgi:hypothetical protein
MSHKSAPSIAGTTGIDFGNNSFIRRRSSQGQGHHALDNLEYQLRDSRGPRLVVPQPGNARGAKPLLPAPDHGFGLSGSPHDFGGAVAVRCQ